MNSNKVIIMEIKDDYAIAMTPEFEFIKIKKKKSMQEGQKIYTTDVVVEETEFVESKNKGTSDNVPTNNANSNSDFEETVSDDEMPF